jgi:hypothetical protein
MTKKNRSNPEIKIKIDKDIDVYLFNSFLNNSIFPQHRNNILKAFNDLKISLNEYDNEQKAVKSFVYDFYKKNKDKINKITEESKLKIKKDGDEALQLLGNTMNYKWKNKTIYEATPTILPFSPYNNNKFYFSILPEIKGSNTKNILKISLHEISHFIFFEQLEDLNINIDKKAKYLLKESLTTAILNRDEFSKIGIPKEEGNPEIRQVMISHNGNTYKLLDFVSKNIDEKDYKKALIFLIKLFKKSEEDFSKKMDLWNKYGKNIINEPQQFKKYKSPVKV